MRSRLNVVDDKLREIISVPSSITPARRKPVLNAKGEAPNDSSGDIDAAASQIDSATALQAATTADAMAPASRCLLTKFHVLTDGEYKMLATQITGSASRTFFTSLDNVLEATTVVLCIDTRCPQT